MAGKSVLLVDTDLSAVELLERSFKERGFQLYSTTSGKDAIQKVAHNRPDLILLEVAVAEMDGWDVCSLLKRNEGTQDIPILFFSDKSNIQNKLRAIQLGANGFIPKTSPTEDLINNIEELIARREDKE